MTTTTTAADQTEAKAPNGKKSGASGKQASEKKPVKKTSRTKKSSAKKSTAKKPSNLEEARREMLRLVCVNSAAITQALIDDALEGKHLSAKFLFETVGLCTLKGEELEDAAEQETLTSLLLKHWEVPSPEGQVTEVLENTAPLALVAEAPVKSELGQAQE
jgi:hypothetical protein